VEIEMTNPNISKDQEIAALRRALTLAESDQIDFLHTCREYVNKTDDEGKKSMRVMRADAVEDRLNITREALALSEPEATLGETSTVALGRLLEARRQRAADAFYEQADIGTVVDDNGWDTVVPGNEMSRDVFIEAEDPNDPSIKLLLTITFKPDTDEFEEITFDGEDITPRPEVDAGDTPGMEM
jgi:hypothetical protein